MFCSKCGKAVVAGATFCMHCGQPLAPARPQTAAPGFSQPAPAFPSPDSANGKKTTTIAVVTALAMILAIFFGLKASGMLQLGATSPKLQALRAEGEVPKQELLKSEGTSPQQDILRAEGSTPNQDLLRAEGSTTPPILDRTQQSVVMPDDIRKWLEHLERIEKRKNDLSMKQLAQLTVLMQQMKVLGAGMDMLNDNGEGDSPQPTDTAKAKFDDMRPEWNRLIADFNSYPPPAECKPIADDFYRAVSEVPGMNSDLAEILTGAAQDPASALEKVYKIQNTSVNVIDKFFGEADERIGRICRKYETRKWFEIKTDVGGGLMSKFGM